MKFEKPDWGIIILALIVGAICILGPAGHIMGATVYAKFFHPTDDGDSARFIVFSGATGDSIAGNTMSEAIDGDGARWTGSATVTELGPLTIWGYVKEGAEPYFAEYDTDLSSLASLDSLGKISARTDSIQWATGDRENAFSKASRNTDADTLWFGIGTDTAWYRVYYHVGGGAGAIPDSTKTFAH
jgi:hypothetical protein